MTEVTRERAALTVLIAEDDDGHAKLLEKNLQRAGFVSRFARARDGSEALEQIRGRVSELDGSSTESLVLILDLNMPNLTGVEVLRRLKSDPHQAAVPVIVLTTTDNPDEIQRCYELGCNNYICKPVDYEKFVETIDRLGRFLEVVELPRPVRS